MGGVVPFGVVTCVQEVTVTPGELLADADFFQYTMGASEKDEEEVNHSGELHRETAEQRANRIISPELSRQGWEESDLATRRRSDPGKVAIAARLRKETTLPIKWIAARVQIGTAKGAKSVLHHLAHRQHQGNTAAGLKPCTQLEFQSAV